MDQQTRKLMTMHKVLNPRTASTDYIYQEQKEKEELPPLKIAKMHYQKAGYQHFEKH